MASYSHSRLNTFEQCKYKYKLQYIDKIKVVIPTTVEAFLGGKVHEAMEKLYHDIQFQKMNTLENLLEFYTNAWQREWTDDILIVKDDYNKNNYLDMGKAYIQDYYHHYHPFDQITILDLETQDRLLLPDGNTYHIRIDKLGCKGNTYYVCDYKTNKRMMDQETADADRQLAMYALWVKGRFKDADKVILLWHMLVFDKEVTSERSEDQLLKLQDEVMGRIAEIETCKTFPTHVTNLCPYCVFKGICPSFKHEVELERKTLKEFKDDEGVKFVDEYATLKSKKKDLEKQIEELEAKLFHFARQKELTMVYGSNKKASIKPEQKVVFPEDKTELTQLIENKGLFKELSMLNHSKMKSMAKKGMLDKDILELFTFEEIFRIHLSNKKNFDKE